MKKVMRTKQCGAARVLLMSMALAVWAMVFSPQARAADVEVQVSDLNAGTRPSYMVGDTLRIVGTQPLNAAGWEVLKNASAAYSLVFANGQTSIPDNAMAVSSAPLTSISGAQVTRVGKRAFYGVINLVSADFPVVTAIDEGAFYACVKLTGASMSAVTSLGQNAFRGCEKLEGASLPALTVVPEGAFANCFALASLNIPVAKTIERYAFDSNSALGAVSLPAATVVDARAFYRATSLVELSMPAITEIGSEAFADCSALKILRLGNADPSVGENAFAGVGRITIYSDRTSLTDKDYPAYDLANPKDSGGGGGCDTGLPLGVLSLCAALLPSFLSFTRRKSAK
jgi:hypothetical protein